MTFPVRRDRLPLFTAACSLLVTSVLVAQAPAKPALAPAPDTANPNQTFTRYAQPGGVALSPDGKTVAWTLRGRDAASIHLTEVADPASPRLITIDGASHCSDGNPVWAPDRQTLAFLSNCAGDRAKPEQEQVFLWSKPTGKILQLTHLVGEIQQPAWSPDGKAIAFLFVENATRHAGALDAMPPWNGVIGEDGVEVQRVYGVDTSSGAGHFLTPATLHVFEFDYAPNSKEIAYIAANPPGENNWWIAKLYGESVSGDQPQVILDPNTVAGSLHGLQIAVPRYSPDGKQIALIGGLMSDQGSTGGDIYVVNAKGGDPVDVTPGIDGTPCFEGWLSDHVVGFVEDRRGHTLLADYNVDKQAPTGTVIDLGEVSVSGGPIKDAVSAVAGGNLTFVKQSP